jgi:hypothetical protein
VEANRFGGFIHAVGSLSSMEDTSVELTRLSRELIVLDSSKGLALEFGRVLSGSRSLEGRRENSPGRLRCASARPYLETGCRDVGFAESGLQPWETTRVRLCLCNSCLLSTATTGAGRVGRLLKRGAPINL